MAKAAGLGPAWHWNHGGFMSDGRNAWNPLTDDGDALRLAVKLQIDVKQYRDHVVAWFDGGYIGTGRIPYDGDPCAATRRAIVLAASQFVPPDSNT